MGLFLKPTSPGREEGRDGKITDGGGEVVGGQTEEDWEGARGW